MASIEIKVELDSGTELLVRKQFGDSVPENGHNFIYVLDSVVHDIVTLARSDSSNN